MCFKSVIVFCLNSRNLIVILLLFCHYYLVIIILLLSALPVLHLFAPLRRSSSAERFGGTQCSSDDSWYVWCVGIDNGGDGLVREW